MLNWIKTKQVRNRILYTLLILGLFYIGTVLTIPNVVTSRPVDNNNFLNLFNLTSGSSLTSFGLFALGVSPYVSASIILGIFAQGLVPHYKRLRESGESGNIKIAQHTRLLAVLIGVIQALSIVFTPSIYLSLGVVLPESNSQKFLIAIIMALGSLLVTYMAELIDTNGIGSGQGLIISVGILTSLPSQIFNSIKFNEFRGEPFWFSFYVMMGVLLIIVIASIIINNIEFKIPLQNLNNTSHTEAHYLPVKLLVSSVTPVIFASASSAIFNWIAQLFGLQLSIFSYQTIEGVLFYALLVLVFAFIYNSIQISGEKISEDLNKTNMYIANIPPSLAKSYINKRIFKISIIGAPVLTLFAAGSMVVELVLPVYLNLALSGTSIFIVVGTIQETISQIKGLTDNKNYSGIFDEQKGGK